MILAWTYPTTDIKEFLTIGCAVLGASLGVINTVTGLSQRRLRLKVIPKTVVRNGRDIFSTNLKVLEDSYPAIEVINLSAFPVTISEAGFTLKGSANRVVCDPSPVIDNKPWPRRLEPREAVTVYFPYGIFPKNLHLAYAQTDCNEKRVGDSPALKKFQSLLESGRWRNRSDRYGQAV